MTRFSDANGQVVIAGLEALPTRKDKRKAAIRSMIPTDDPSDRAHTVRELARVERLLMPGSMVPNARPRRYFPCHMVTVWTSRGVRRVSIDSIYDATWARAKRLAEAGVNLTPDNAAEVRNRALAMMDYEHARNATRRNHAQSMTRDEIELERRANELLAGCRHRATG